VTDLAEQLDYVNVLAVNPGFAGQSFIGTTPGRIARLRGLLPEGVVIEVDGGIDRATLPAACEAGAAIFVSASAIFGARDPAAAYAELAALAAA
jgi:ribulose-phosphate 3-epimerase